jgi:predicted PurR-regulated permease PerM
LQGGSWLVRHSLDLGQGIIQLVLSVFIAYFFYRDGDRVVARIVAGGRRIAGDQTQYVLGVVGHTVRGVVYGVIGTAMAQGILAGFGFWIADVPSPLLLGLLTFVLSSILLGAPIVWVPVVVWLFAERSIGWGVFMGVWGTFVVSGVDNLIRPYLISRGAGLPFIIIFLGGIGGLLAFGLIGIFLGPTLLAVGHSLIKEFSDGTAAGGGAGRRFGRRRARPGGEGGTGDGRQEDDGTGRDSAAGH